MKMTPEVKQARAEARKQARIEAKIQAVITRQKEQPDVKSLTINVEWKKSRTWGSNPRATASCETVGGRFHTVGPFSCSGCGYDKESQVVSDIFNDCMCGMLQRADWTKEKPYGVREYAGKRYFEGAIGMSCYYDIAKFIGGTLEHVSSGNMFDVYRFTINA